LCECTISERVDVTPYVKSKANYSCLHSKCTTALHYEVTPTEKKEEEEEEEEE
jgi:hypothetical protein